MNGSHMSWWRVIYAEGDKKSTLNRQVLRRVMGYTQPYKTQIIGMFVTIVISSVLGLIGPLILRDIIDNALPHKDLGRLTLLSVALMIVPLVNALVLVFQRWLNAAIGEGVIYDLRYQLYRHMQAMSLRFFTNTKVGELMSRLNNDVVGAQRAVNTTLVSIVTNSMSVIATLVMMFIFEPRLTLLGLIVVPFFILPARRMSSVLRNIARYQMEQNAKMNALMNETLNISGVMLVKLFGRGDNENQRFERRAASVRDAGVRQAVSGSFFFAFLGLIGAVGTAIVYYVGGRLVLDDAFTIGTLVAFAALLAQLYGPLQALVNAPVDFVTSMTSFERVFEILDIEVEIQEKSDAVELKELQGRVVFDGVSFAYETQGDEGLLLSDVKRYHSMDSVSRVMSDEEEDDKSKAKSNGKNGANSHQPDNLEPVVEANNSQARTLALNNVSFEIEPGQLVALVGPSGAGKTTITYLLPRLYDPTEGNIFVDGHNLRDVTLKSLSEHIGMVTQETYLFHDTLRMNLLYAKPDATQEEIETACRAANIHEFIMGLEEGYETIAGERGYRLSGGEKQRLAIARVLLKDPSILVLDEATSHLDSQSEKLIQSALERVMEGRTSVVIAHRLSTILKADQIFVMDRGEIVERGSHDELMAQDGLYTQLYRTQFSDSPVLAE